MHGGPIKDPEDLAEATRVIRLYASDKRTTITYTRHAEERCQERELSPIWIQEVLKMGTAVSFRYDEFCGKRIYRYRVTYTDEFGRTEVITVVPGALRLTIVTVMRDD